MTQKQDSGTDISGFSLPHPSDPRDPWLKNPAPRRILCVLCLRSEERGVGKEWLNMWAHSCDRCDRWLVCHTIGSHATSLCFLTSDPPFSDNPPEVLPADYAE